MNKKFHGALCAGIFSLGLAASVGAVPISEQSLIHVRQFENQFHSTILDNFITTENSISNVLDTSSGSGSHVQGHANIFTGKHGTFASTPDSPQVAGANSRIVTYDTLTFSTQNNLSTDISYQITLDGNLSNSDSTYLGLGGHAFAQTRISIYDITGLNTWLDDNGSFNKNSAASLVDFGLGSPVSRTNIQFAVGAQGSLDLFGFSDPQAPELTDTVIVNTNGTVFDFDLSKTGTFTADPTKKYGIEIWNRSSVSGAGGLSDFLNTSTFSFTDLNGATFNSGSGAFLSATTTVSEPSMLALFSIGLLGLMGRTGGKS